MGLLTLLTNCSKPAPSVCQFNFSRPVKEGLDLKTSRIIGSEMLKTMANPDASRVAREATLVSAIGSREKPAYGGKAFSAVMNSFRGSFNGEPCIRGNKGLSLVIEGFYTDLPNWLIAVKSFDTFSTKINATITSSRDS